MQCVLKRTMGKTRKKNPSDPSLPKTTTSHFFLKFSDLKISLHNGKMFMGFYTDIGCYKSETPTVSPSNTLENLCYFQCLPFHGQFLSLISVNLY